MTSREPEPTEPAGLADEITLEAVATTLLRWRRQILVLVFAGGLVGGLYGLLKRRMFESAATFIPQSNNSAPSPSLAMAASQFGIQIPNMGGGAWGPPVYVELLKSQDLLEPIARDTVTLAEEGGRRAAVMDLLDIPARYAPARRLDRTVAVLRKRIAAYEDKKLAGVVMSVETPWPSLSLALADKLVASVSNFNRVTRKSQATAEREFAEAASTDAERALRAAEDQMREFQLGNRTVLSPNLTLDRDRLQRQVTLRNTIYTSLLQAREEAKLREVRDTPVITIIKSPRLPVTGKSRGVVLKAMFGAAAAGLLGVLLALIGEAVAVARRSPRPATRELMQELSDAKPRFLRRSASKP